MDDDDSIHQVWRGKFAPFKKENISVIHFKKADELIAWCEQQKLLPESSLHSTLFLVDYELVGSETNGLETLISLGLQKQGILVTSRYEEPSVQIRCAQHSIRLIPKAMAGFVPVSTTI